MNKQLIPGVVSRAAVHGVFALVLIGAAWTAPAQAGLILDLTPAASPSHGTCPACGTGTVRGWSFAVNTPITVDGIGVFDSFTVPRSFSTEAGLWTSSGTLLRSATITTGVSTPVASVNPNGQWLFESFSPLTLPVGNYLLGNVFFSNAPAFSSARENTTTIPQITFTSGVIGPFNGGFVVPAPTTSSPAFGPTLETVPEPATLGLMVLGLLGAVFAGRKRRS